METFSKYYRLTKPGIIRGNLLIVTVGSIVGTNAKFDIPSYLWLIIGISSVIAACVFNNIYDRKIDLLMDRTKDRALASGHISVLQATIFGLILYIVGTGVLLLKSSILVSAMALVAFISYVFIYSPAKHRTKYATLIGTIPGSLPIVAGYVSVSNVVDTTAILLLLLIGLAGKSLTFTPLHCFAVPNTKKLKYRSGRI